MGKWTDENLKEAILLLQNGHSHFVIGNKINKSQIAVAKKLNKLGYGSNYDSNANRRGKTKYIEINWVDVQTAYDAGLTYRDLIIKLNLSSRSIDWAIKNGHLKLRSISDGVKNAWKDGKYGQSNAIGIRRYRQLCEFRFNVYHFPDKFNLTLLEKHGWYRAKNRGDNPNGVSRDHMYSVKEGFINNIDPCYISHPANCCLMIHTENNNKKTKSSISFEELMDRIKNW